MEANYSPKFGTGAEGLSWLLLIVVLISCTSICIHVCPWACSPTILFPPHIATGECWQCCVRTPRVLFELDHKLFVKFSFVSY